MKNRILIIISAVVIVCSFVACSANSGSKNVSTTAVTDSNGTTHYYEPVTDENKQIVTYNNGEVVTTEITTKSKTTNTNASPTSAESGADNVVEFEPITENTTSNTNNANMTTTTEMSETTQNTTQSATDSAGWINKWY